MRSIGSSIGAGVVVLLTTGVCPLAEVAHVVGYLDGEGAGQCGPCVHGLAALSTAVGRLAFAPSRHSGVASIESLCGLIEGRARVDHPDGAARFVRSAMRTFGEHVDHHLRRGPCRPAAPVMAVPRHRRIA